MTTPSHHLLFKPEVFLDLARETRSRFRMLSDDTIYHILMPYIRNPLMICEIAPSLTYRTVVNLSDEEFRLFYKDVSNLTKEKTSPNLESFLAKYPLFNFLEHDISEGQSLLLAAIQNLNPKLVQDILNKPGSETLINKGYYQFMKGRSFPLVAMMHNWDPNHVEMCRILLENGANPNLVGMKDWLLVECPGMTLLHLATHEQHAEVTRQLLKHGAAMYPASVSYRQEQFLTMMKSVVKIEQEKVLSLN